MNQEITFGQSVKERQELLGLTQAELGRRVGCAAIIIRRIEADNLRPSVQIAEHLDIALITTSKARTNPATTKPEIVASFQIRLAVILFINCSLNRKKTPNGKPNVPKIQASIKSFFFAIGPIDTPRTSPRCHQPDNSKSSHQASYASYNLFYYGVFCVWKFHNMGLVVMMFMKVPRSIGNVRWRLRVGKPQAHVQQPCDC